MEFLVREAREEDAAAMIRYAEAIFAERGLDLPTSPGEFRMTREQEEDVIRRHHEQANAVFLLAVGPSGEILGMLNCRGSERQALRHCCEMGISVAAGHRGEGIGRGLMEEMFAWARRGGVVRRIELKVYARNTRAIRLYRRYGFRFEGRRRAAVFQDGVFLDDLVMARVL